MGFKELTAGVTGGQVLRYMLLPQIIPRLKAFGAEGFSNLAYLMALVYRAVNILPENHAVFKPENRYNLGIRQVIALAGSHLQFKKSHIDQIVIYFSILVGMVLLALQFVLLIGYILMNPAFAQDMPTTYAEFFMDPHKDDIVYLMLYAIFGVPELFKVGAERQDFHVALHSLFQLYSIGLLVIAVLIICYFVFAVLVETAQTGTPFGKRYNHVWTPIRLVVALGLLIPVGYGLNSAQWITLHAAKLGSDFATKGWVLFNDKMNSEYMEDANSLVGTPKRPNVNSVVAFMTVALTCKEAYEAKPIELTPDAIKPYVIRYDGAGSDAEMLGEPPTLEQFMSQEKSDAKAAASKAKSKSGKANTPRKKDVYIRFGVYDSEVFADEAGKVFSFCGDLAVLRADATEPGSEYMQQFYMNLVKDLWKGDYGIKKAAQKISRARQVGADGALSEINTEFKYSAMKSINKKIDAAIKESVTRQLNSETWKKDAESIYQYGWGGAGMWYNKIAQINGSLVTAVQNIPQVRARPAVLDHLEKRRVNASQDSPQRFSMAAGKYPIPMSTANDEILVAPLQYAYDLWQNDPSFGEFGGQGSMTGNVFIDMINLIFGTQGLFAMCQNTDIHPLAQLSQLGKGLVEASIRNIGASLLFTGVSLIAPGFIGGAASAASGILMSVASITIVMGFVLYHVVPFMPFIYFFFAVGGWIKGLFEAMVGVPLWALSFLKIDGDGLPGNSAMDGFYLILEIFLRPIMILFGLLASVVIFAAMVKILNEIFFLVVYNVTGHDPGSTAMCGGTPTGTGSGDGTAPTAIEFFRGPIDELFFTVMYAVIVYMIGMSCFKLIDQVPNNILRYMGQSVNSFNDKAADPTSDMIRNISLGGSMISSKVFGDGGIIQGATGAVGNTIRGMKDLTTPPPPPSGT